ncbi:MAG TPA: CAP domain-containing protein [Solirubrobacteraceae bacterium]
MPRGTRSTIFSAACITAVAALMVAPAAGGSVHVILPVPRPPAQCAGADSLAIAASPQTLRSAVVCLVNQQRTKRGLPPLTASDQLDRSAQGWTQTMVRTRRFTHGPGDAFARRISATGYSWQTAGENIATGFPTPRSVVAGWMASTDHCRNILNPSFRDVGTGESDSAVGTFASGPATWTQDFGLRMRASAPSRNRGPMNGCPY